MHECEPLITGDPNKLPAFVTVHDFRAEVSELVLARERAAGTGGQCARHVIKRMLTRRFLSSVDRFRYIAWVECPYRVAGKASALRMGKRASD